MSAAGVPSGAMPVYIIAARTNTTRSIPYRNAMLPPIIAFACIAHPFSIPHNKNLVTRRGEKCDQVECREDSNLLSQHLDGTVNQFCDCSLYGIR